MPNGKKGAAAKSPKVQGEEPASGFKKRIKGVGDFIDNLATLAKVFGIIFVWAGTIGAAFFGGHHAATSSSAASASVPTIKITSPKTNGTVPRCFNIQGYATNVANDDILITVLGSNPSLYYLTNPAKTYAAATPNEVSWGLPVTIGGQTAPGSVYHISVYVVPAAEVDFLENLGAAKVPFSPYGLGALADTAPPVSLASDSRQVVRDTGTNEPYCTS